MMRAFEPRLAMLNPHMMYVCGQRIVAACNNVPIFTFIPFKEW
jgi:hypothetical protein